MDEARLALIIAAIAALKPEDFTKAGPPNMTVLKAAIPDITAEERDTAWAKVQEEAAKNAPPTSKAAPAAAAAAQIITCEDVMKSLRAQGRKI
jgi:hypothetical protein